MIPGRVGQKGFRAHFRKSPGVQHFFGPLAYAAFSGKDHFPRAFGMGVKLLLEIGHPTQFSSGGKGRLPFL